MKRLSLLLLLLVASLPLCAQTPVSLEEYRDEVAAYSRSLRISAARTAAAREQAGRARTGYLPRLSMEGDFSLTARRPGDGERWTFSLLPQLVQTLYAGGAVRADIRSTELDHRVALCEEEFSLLEVRFAADRAYWNLSAMNRYEESIRRYVELIRSLKEVIDRRFEEGYIAKGDVLMIDSRLSEAEYELVSAGQRVAVARHNFNLLRGVDPEYPAALCCDIRDSLVMPVRVGGEQTLDRRPDYAASLLRAERAETGIRAARAPFNPQLSVGVGGSWQPYSPNRTGATYADGVAFVKLSVPIFHGGERRRAVAAARAVHMESVWTAEQTRDALLAEEADGWTMLVQSHAQVEAVERSLRIASENLELSTYSYGEGLTTVLDVMQAQVSWIQIYSNAIRAHFDYAVAVSDYRRITAQE